jgi:hypothetical protein
MYEIIVHLLVKVQNKKIRKYCLKSITTNAQHMMYTDNIL